MKRRKFLTTSVGVAGSIATFGSVRADIPCPPSLQGGTAECATQGALAIGTVQQEAITPEQIALYAPISGQIDPSTTASVEFKLPSVSTWTRAHPLFRLDGTGDAFAGAIFDLMPGQTYDVRVTFDDGAVQDVRTAQFMTRSLPPENLAATVRVASVAELNTAMTSASPGDVIEMQPGDYSGLGRIRASGTASDPVYIRGSDRAAVTMAATIDIDADWVVFENVTINGNGNRRQRGIRLGITDGCTGVVVRNCVINAARAINAAGGTSGDITDACLIYNNVCTGLAPWNLEGLSTNTYWSEDGIRIVGRGNCVWNNTLEGFGDTIALAHSVSQRDGTIVANFIYRNLIRNGVDDCIEFDHAQRTNAFYDNYCENVKTCISLSDERFLGPQYIFRNAFINVGLRALKATAPSNGSFIYSNTFLRADSYPGGNQRGEGHGDGSPSGDPDWFAWRNNILVFRSPSPTDIIDLTYGGNNLTNVEWTHNAHYPDISIRFRGENPSAFTSLRDAQRNIRPTAPVFDSRARLGAPTRRFQNDVITSSDPFAVNITLGNDCLLEVTGLAIPAIANGQTPKNAGIAIPNITDGFSGAAPDMGAIIEGRAPITYGARLL